MDKSLLVSSFVVVAALAIGAYFFPVQQPPTGTSVAGSTFNTSKIAGVAFAPASPGANATSSSVLNSDASDRIVTAVEFGCENVGTSKTAYTGTGLAAFQVSVGTSSTAAPASVPTNLIGGGAITIATSSGTFVLASSTAPNSGTPVFSLVWAAGSYMTFFTNATNTATCTGAVRYLGQ